MVETDLRIVELMKTGFKLGVEEGCFTLTLKRQLTGLKGRGIKGDWPTKTKAITDWLIESNLASWKWSEKKTDGVKQRRFIHRSASTSLNFHLASLPDI